MFGGWLAGGGSKTLRSKTLRGRRGAAAGAGEGRAEFGEGMWTVANWPVCSSPLYASVWGGGGEGGARVFPMVGKKGGSFSNGWKKRGGFFQWLEKVLAVFPTIGKTEGAVAVRG